MMSTALSPWTESNKPIVPANARKPAEIVLYAAQLSPRDKQQIVAGFKSGSYEMTAGFILKRTLSTLKRQLSSLGMSFIGEMLGRSDIDEDSSASISISDFEAITLARELGIISSIDAKRLVQHVELLAYFDESLPNDFEAPEMDADEAKITLRTCVQSILGKDNVEAPIEFREFRSALEERPLKSTDTDVSALSNSPYFFKKITLSVLLAGAKTRTVAKFEHILGNILTIVPLLWPTLNDPERWAVGQSYAEAVNSGNRAASVALKKALSEVKGFDFVPETLRSQAFMTAAGAILEVHGAYNNFYNEPPLMSALAKLGSTIPWPAFPVCMSATLAVKLGNRYGISHAAQDSADVILQRLTDNQWEYYLNKCLSSDELILYKLAWSEGPADRWAKIVDDFNLKARAVKSSHVKTIVKDAAVRAKLKPAAEHLWNSARG